MSASSLTSALLVRVVERTCALNLLDVLEIMRPLPVDELANTPSFVCGLSMIRGTPTPVVSLASLFPGPGPLPTRFVVVRAGGRRVALAVDAVIGIREFASSDFKKMPPLLRDAARGTVETIGALDSELFFVLHTASLIPDELVESLAGPER